MLFLVNQRSCLLKKEVISFIEHVTRDEKYEGVMLNEVIRELSILLDSEWCANLDRSLLRIQYLYL